MKGQTVSIPSVVKLSQRNRRAKKNTGLKTMVAIPSNSLEGQAVSMQTRVLDFTRADSRYDNRQVDIFQWINYGQVISTSAAAGLYAFSSVFTDFPDSTSYANTYDQYKFVDIEYHFIPLTQLSSPASAPGWAPLIVYHDYDDAATPSNASAGFPYSNMVITNVGERHSRKIRPHMAVAATSSGAAAITGAKNSPADWIDTTSLSVPHYGIKVIVPQSTSTNVNAWQLYARLHAKLRNQR